MAYDKFFVRVDSVETLKLIDKTMEAVGPASLAIFLDATVQPYFAQEIIDRFAVEGDEKSGSWAPLSDATNDIRERLGYPPEHPILERSGDLLHALVEKYDLTLMEPSGAMLMIPGNLDLETETKLQAAQVGVPEGQNEYYGPTPARPVLAVDPTDLASIVGMLQWYIMEYVVGGATSGAGAILGPG